MKSPSIAVFVLSLPWLATAWPLDSVIARGDSCVQILWTPDSANTDNAWFLECGAACTGSDTVCLHSDFTAGNTYRGIAYSYGGDDAYLLFRERLAAGDLAGSHLCHYLTCGDPSDVVTGIDCSAFNCWAWDVARQSTSGLFANVAYEHIPKSEMQPGDMLVNPGSHSVMLIEQDDETHWVVHEATGTPINGCRERLVDITAGTWNAYTPIRNPEIGITAGAYPFAPSSGESFDWAAWLGKKKIHARALPKFVKIVFFSLDGKTLGEIGPKASTYTRSGRIHGVVVFRVLLPDYGSVSGFAHRLPSN